MGGTRGTVIFTIISSKQRLIATKSHLYRNADNVYSPFSESTILTYRLVCICYVIPF